jgi:ATP-dependent DNA helicase RecG
MTPMLQMLKEWLDAKEDEHLEFKEAKGGFHFEELVKYCLALANEGGGKMIIGVTDKRPRRVVGTSAFDQPERTRRGLLDRVPLRIDFDDLHHRQGRVLDCHVPSRPVGMPMQYDGKFWMRDADSLVPLSPEQLLRDAEAIVAGGITNAALVLFGTRSALGKHLAQAEVVFEYRS